jgi:carbon-monoxide dehydrogenase large subunit
MDVPTGPLLRNAAQVGQPLPRLEDERHLAGQGRFVADVQLSGTKEVAFLRSPVAHATFLPIAVPEGVPAAAVWTAERLAELVRPIRAVLDRPAFRPSDQPVMAAGTVRHVGEIMAAVVAETRAVAEDLAETLQPDFSPLPVVSDPEAALSPGAAVLHPGWTDNVYMTMARTIGPFEENVSKAEVHVTRRLTMARIAALPLETRGCVASYDHGSRVLTLYLSAQRPHLIRTMLAEQLTGIEERDIRVIAPDVGGGFGGKSNLYPEEIILAAMAMQVNHPLRWVEDRWEHMVSASQSRQHVQTITAHAMRDGTLMAVEARFLVDGGAYAMRTSTPAVEANMASSVLPGPYHLPAYRFEATTVATNKTPVGPFRGVGRPAAVFAMERIMEEVAAEIGMDPVTFRLKNMIRPEEHPYTTISGLRYDSGDYPSLIRKTAQALDMPAIRAAQRAAEGTNLAIGVGFGCYTEQTAHGAEEWHRRGSPFVYGFESARVRIDPAGGVLVSTGIQSHGQGLETSLAQIAADVLGVTYDAVRVQHGDTDLCPYGMGTVASRSLVMAGGAVHGACQRLAAKMRLIAAANLNCAPEQVTLGDGVARGPEDALTIAQIGRIAYLEVQKLPREVEPGLEVLFNYRPSVETGAYSAGVHAAKVAVDLDSLQVRLLDFVVAEDCGRVINPLIVDGQIIGGVAQGIGQALLEELGYDSEGQPTRVTLADYLVPGAGEVPHIRIIHQETLSPFTVHGAKGLGEGGCIGPPAAVANAVSDALRRFGVDVRSVPIRPDDLWRALREKAA